MDIYGMSDKEIQREIGRRLKARRLRLNLTQGEAATRAGLGRTTVAQLEGGHPVKLLSLIQLLRALGSLSDLDQLLPESGPSPVQLAKLAGKRRLRASPQRLRASDKDEEESAW